MFGRAIERQRAPRRGRMFDGEAALEIQTRDRGREARIGPLHLQDRLPTPIDSPSSVPHPEERPPGRVSKDGRAAAANDIRLLLERRNLIFRRGLFRITDEARGEEAANDTRTYVSG